MRERQYILCKHIFYVSKEKLYLILARPGKTDHTNQNALRFRFSKQLTEKKFWLVYSKYILNWVNMLVFKMEFDH